MIMWGKLSWFGGPNDPGMDYDEGLAWYEHWEADTRTDLFLPRSKDPAQGCSKRLRCNDTYYIALNTSPHYHRKIIHESRWKIRNMVTGDYVIAQLVDQGPGYPGRLVDCSKALMIAIGMRPEYDTDKEVEVSEASSFGIQFGLYGDIK